MTSDTKTRVQVEEAVNTMLGTISLTDTKHAAAVILDADAALRAEVEALKRNKQIADALLLEGSQKIDELRAELE